MAWRLKKIEEQEVSGPPRTDWDFHEHSDLIPADREIQACLHYEYARSCRPVVERVIAVRKCPKLSVYFDFCSFLAHTFAEFPEMAWNQIDPSRRDKILRMEPQLPAHDQPSIRAKILEGYDIHDFLDELALENIGLPASPATDRFAVIQINFNKEDSEIIDRFREWLQLRRAYLTEKHSRAPTLTPTAKELIVQRFHPRRNIGQSGRGSANRTSVSCLRRLGAARLLRFFEHDWKKAQALLHCHGKGSL